MLLGYRSHQLIFQVNQLHLHLQSALRTRRNAFSASIAFLGVNNNVEFA
jgi:hypothetical protein